MNIGMIGLGKLGLPCALEIERCGHNVFGYDPSPQIQEILDSRILPYKERLADEYLKTHSVNFVSVENVIHKSDIIFVAVQTPHHPKYEGITRIPRERADFDYHYLINCLKEISAIVDAAEEDKIIVIISTVLTIKLVQDVVNFLSRRPYVEVSDLISRIMAESSSQKTEEKKEEAASST